MASRGIVTEQVVKQEKFMTAKKLRKDMTKEEKILWQCLRGNQLKGFHFRRQQIIKGFIVDFYCHKAGLIIELDGEIHEKQTEYDQVRDKILEAYGLKILRIKNQELETDLSEVLIKITEHLEK